MGPLLTPQKAIENELACYYHGDELPPLHSTAFRVSLRRRTWASAVRLRRAVGPDAVAQLITALQSMKSEPYGFLMCVVIEATLIGWPDDPCDWAVFQQIVDQIIEQLRGSAMDQIRTPARLRS